MKQYNEMGAEIVKLEAELAEARAQIAAKDAALDALDEAHQITQQNLWQDITELRASLAGKEQEHQDFRLQNDSEWRAKLDHLKAQIAAKDADLDQYAALLDACGAQIAAKDAALLKAKDAAQRGAMNQVIRVINAALAAPARETE